MTTSPARAARAPDASPTEFQLANFRAQLLEQRGFRSQQLRMLCRTRVSSSRISREITASLIVAARSALRDVTAALQRMDEGSYGRCTSCAGQLPLERLEVLPQVAMCMTCQRAAEDG